ncbi:hypothetical protein [Brucella anthropi]|uniref:hypothetical protein n=1 Tax=Brucella anthropi TaxID=529 RepID=UPI00244AE13E|nr:hypothetical protein [Brucella anthropi]MDH0369682.1 hypothetical protein [Brucella anthropi]
MDAKLDLGQGFPEWTELGQDSGLDPLGMQRPIEVIYQSLVPGISTITLRYRYYSLFPLIIRRYEERIRNSDPEVFRLFQRRCEALYALICTYGEPELGITGSDWAGKILNSVIAETGVSGVIDFRAGADPTAHESLRYLRNKGGAFGAIYSTQMAEIGLVHLAAPTDANPNPVCSDLALKVADAFAQELGETADQFFDFAEAGSITVASLANFEAMKPRALRPGSAEHILLKEILLGKSGKQSDADRRRRQTLTMLLKLSDTAKKVPRAEETKWHWFESVSSFEGDNGQEVPQLWFLYQASDLLRLAYEAVLSAALTLLQQAPRLRMSLGELTGELAGFVETLDGETWEAFSARHAATSRMAIREVAAAMLAAKNSGETAAQVQNAFVLIAMLTDRAADAADLIDKTLGNADHFQSLRTETHFLDRRQGNPADFVIADLIRERVVKRHLWVASRKFRNQLAYTFHIEPEDGLLRYRSDFRVAPSSPRIDQAVRFLRDLSLIDDNGLTSEGRAEVAEA